MTEFTEMLTLWARYNIDAGVREVHAVVADTRNTGGCHTCADTEAVVHVSYTTNYGELRTKTIVADYPHLIRTLGRWAALRDAMTELPGRTDMVWKILSEFLTYPNEDGIEVKAVKGDIVGYLPRVSLPWLIQQGHVTPLCASGMDDEDCDCRWHRLGALTGDDRRWLKQFGWDNPFADQP